MIWSIVARVAPIVWLSSIIASFLGRREPRVKWRRLPDNDERVLAAMEFARKTLGITEPFPVEWWSAPGTHRHPDGGWGVPSKDGSGRIVRGQTFRTKRGIRVNVYSDPTDGLLVYDTMRHEAVHAVGWVLLGHRKGGVSHPRYAPGGQQLIYKVPYWS